jgi:hypothetical protein
MESSHSLRGRISSRVTARKPSYAFKRQSGLPPKPKFSSASSDSSGTSTAKRTKQEHYFVLVDQGNKKGPLGWANSLQKLTSLDLI